MQTLIFETPFVQPVILDHPTMHLPTIILISFLNLLPILSLALSSTPLNLLTLSTTTTDATNLTLPPPLTAPSPTCLKITEPSMVGLNPTNCEICTQIICIKLTQPRPEQLRRDKWIWAELEGCSLGYYLPDEALVPSSGQCTGTFEAIVQTCSTDSRFNAGVVNVRDLPDFSGDGRAVEEGKLRYAMAPERLTLF